jgi:hypothetical protein
LCALVIVASCGEDESPDAIRKPPSTASDAAAGPHFERGGVVPAIALVGAADGVLAAAFNSAERTAQLSWLDADANKWQDVAPPAFLPTAVSPRVVASGKTIVVAGGNCAQPTGLGEEGCIDAGVSVRYAVLADDRAAFEDGTVLGPERSRLLRKVRDLQLGVAPSGDGELIVVMSGASGANELWRVNPASGRWTQLSTPPFRVTNPCETSDGRVYASIAAAGPGDAAGAIAELRDGAWRRLPDTGIPAPSGSATLVCRDDDVVVVGSAKFRVLPGGEDGDVVPAAPGLARLANVSSAGSPAVLRYQLTDGADQPSELGSFVGGELRFTLIGDNVEAAAIAGDGTVVSVASDPASATRAWRVADLTDMRR